MGHGVDVNSLGMAVVCCVFVRGMYVCTYNIMELRVYILQMGPNWLAVVSVPFGLHAVTCVCSYVCCA